MYNERPKIQVSYESVDYVLELSCIAIIIMIWAYVFSEYSTLPDTIPTHFNAAGIADDFGSKSTLFMMPVIATVLYGLLFVLNLYPHLHNYSVNITKENAYKNYQLSTRFLRIVNVLLCILFGYISFSMVNSAITPEQGIGSYVLPVIISVSVLVPVLGLYYQRKINKTTS